MKGKSFRAVALDAERKKDTICNAVNHLLTNLKSTAEVTRALGPQRYFGNHIVDAKFIPVKTVVITKPSLVPRSAKRRKLTRGIVHVSGSDYETHDIPVALMSRTEEFWAYDRYFNQLKALNYPLRSLTCDDKPAIRLACLTHYPDAKIQLCLRHYAEEVARKLKIRSIERTIQSLEKKLAAMGDDFSYPSRPEAQERAVEIVNRIADLEHRYWIAATFSAILYALIHAKTQEAYTYHATELNDFFRTWLALERGTMRQRILAIFKKFERDKELLFTSLRFPELRIPRTTNLQEGYHSHWELRLSSIRGFESEETATNYMNALVLKKRFSVFTSCRGRFKTLNGKSPLEHSGGLTSTLKDWVSFCIRKK